MRFPSARDAAYLEYQKKVSRLVPLPPRGKLA